MKLLYSSLEDFEGSGGSGDDTDVIRNSVIMTSERTWNVTTTTATSQPSPVTTVLTSILRDAVTSATTVVSSSTTARNETTSSDVAGIVTERLFIFVGVLVALVIIAIGIVLYIKCVHEKRPEPDPFAGHKI